MRRGKRVKPLRSGPRNGQIHVHASQSEIALELLQVRHMAWTTCIVSNSLLPLPGLTTHGD